MVYVWWLLHNVYQIEGFELQVRIFLSTYFIQYEKWRVETILLI